MSVLLVSVTNGQKSRGVNSRPYDDTQLKDPYSYIGPWYFVHQTNQNFCPRDTYQHIEHVTYFYGPVLPLLCDFR